MDTALAGLLVLMLLAFAGLTAVQSCDETPRLEFREWQEVAEREGRGEYYVDPQGRERFKIFDKLER